MILLDQLTLAEKAGLTAGRDVWSTQPVERLGVASIVLTDGPHGVRLQPSTRGLELGDAHPATCFPTAPALAATWDPDLVEDVGVALGEEARALGVSVLLGPGANIKRTPVCGRNFEYFSEDPLLSSAIAAGWVRGVQRTGVAASLKHLAANNQEHRRYSTDSVVDERALREVYLASFERAVVQARPGTVMASYNRLNGPHTSEHRELLTTVLRDEWGFEGLVVSDWGAVFDRVPAIAAGCDLQMPGFGGAGDADLVSAVERGLLPAAALDASAQRVLDLVAATAPAREPGPDAGHGAQHEAHHELARRVAAEGTVLLKNEGGLLPLAPTSKVAVIGAFAEAPRYQGAGSSLVNPTRLDDALSAIRRLCGEQAVAYCPGYDRGTGSTTDQLLAQARTAAAAADVVLVFVGLPESYETEGVDRTHLRLPAGHDALVRAVASANPRVGVVLANGAPVEMPWVADVAAVVEGYLGGQAGGSATADVLFGVREPGGRLAETFPRRWSDNPVSALPVGPVTVEYRESVYVGYRYYDSVGADVLFPFGHGLSYTTFELTDLGLDAGPGADGPDLEVAVAVTVTNTGHRSGAEVVQVYVHDEQCATFRPAHELRAFAKVRLEPGEARRVVLRLDRRAFAFWDRHRHEWVVEPGRFEVRVGASSRDVRLAAWVDVSAAPGAEPPTPDAAALAAYRDLAPGAPFGREPFAALYGRPLPDNHPDRRGGYTLDTPLADMHESWLARGLLRVARTAVRRMFAGADAGNEGGDEGGAGTNLAAMADSLVEEMPLRMLPLASQGRLGRPPAEALLALANGQRVCGIGQLAGLLRGRVWGRGRTR